MNSPLAILRRKARQVGADPVLRRYLLARLLGRVARPPAFKPGQPPYLTAAPALNPPATIAFGVSEPAAAPSQPITLRLPGLSVTLHPGEESALMARDFADTETMLGLHRFAWLPLMEGAADPAWVAALWQAWVRRHGAPTPGWPWHPYTTAERAINILDHARRHGLPGPQGETQALLARHGSEIASRLEYFGDHYTGNHLANNGRGLYLLGLALGWEACADLGRDILLNEARRIFLPSGMLSEGSSHYHLLLTRGYASAWLAACRHRRPEATELEMVLSRALGAAARLALPGGMPLVGDISPDCPPNFLAGLLPGGDLRRGWGALLDDDDRTALTRLRDGADPLAGPEIDGWLTIDRAGWQALWHCAPQGWAPMPGHGHQDVGAFELHHRGIPVFIDPGRGHYGESGDAAWYRDGLAHNGLVVDETDPYAANRPYYDDTFRRMIGGAPPRLTRADGSVALAHHGYRRIGVPLIERNWRFEPDRMMVEDSATGTGTHTITRSFFTPWRVEPAGEQKVALYHGETVLTLSADAPIRVEQAIRWYAYGEGMPISVLRIETRAALPWRGTVVLAEG